MLVKLSFVIVFFFLCSSLDAQTDYYKSAEGLSGESLKDALNNIISGHTELPYTSTAIDVWDVLKETDKDPNDPSKVILIYSGRSVDAAQEYNGGNGWSREHVWAKSRGDFGTSKGAGTDVHHLKPADVSINSTRNNRNFDDCISCEEVIDEGLKTGSFTDRNRWVFEPRDEVKGDVARMIFYMAVRYEGEDGDPDLELTDVLLDKSDIRPLHAISATLLEWHRSDPVSQWERDRNELIYSKYQGNRNPFIDYSELAEFFWGDSIGIAWNPRPLSAFETFFNQEGKVYPNPTNGKINIGVNYDSLKIYNSSGQEIKIQNQLDPDISGFPTGTYKLLIFRKDLLIERFEIIKN